MKDTDTVGPTHGGDEGESFLFMFVCVCAINKIKSICSHICWNNTNKKNSPPLSAMWTIQQLKI